jgi:RNA polymerase sigma-70 factor (ECF subfamily)
MSTTDQVLLQQWVHHRDAEAFRTIALRHAAMVYNTSRRILRNSHDAEDVAQECFEALVRAGDKPGAYLGAWLHRVATNLSLNRAVSGRRRQAREDQFTEDDTAASEPFDAELYTHVDKAIAALPDKLRQPLVAHYLENQTHEAIAESIGVSRQTVTYRVGQGVERVRADLKRKGVMVAATGLSAFLLANNSEAVPTALASALGKLAVAGHAAAVAGTGLADIHGLLSLKGLMAAAAVVALGAAGTLALRPEIPASHAAKPSLDTPTKRAAFQPPPLAGLKPTQSPNPAAPEDAATPIPKPTSETAPSELRTQAKPKDRRGEVERTLKNPVSMEFENIQLAGILSFISDSNDLNIALDPRVVSPQTQPGPDPDFVTDGQVPYIDVRNVSLGDALRTLCRPLGLDFAMNDGFITVSSPALLDADGFTRLSRGDDSGDPALQQNVSLAFEDVHLSEILEFAADTYDVNITIDHRAVAPPQNRIAPKQPDPPFVTTGFVPYVSLKNVSMTAGLDALLRPLNLAYSVEDGFLWVSSPERIAQENFAAPDTSRAEPALVGALQAPHDFEFDEKPLSETLAAMAESAGVSIEVDATNPDIAAARVDDYAVKDLPLGTALGILLREHDLAYAVNGQDIIVTSPALARSDNPARLNVVPARQVANP